MSRSALPLMAFMALTLSGCIFLEPTTSLAPAEHHGTVSDEPSPDTALSVDTLRTGRYRLTRTLPTREQANLLEQIVEITIASRFAPSVGDGIRHVLSRTGYSLCPENAQNQLLYSRELPAAHFAIGPLRLNTALQMLAGPAWRVEIDEVSRSICYHLDPQYLPLAAAALAGRTAP